MAKQLNIDGSNYDQYFSQIIDNVEYILHVYYNSRGGWYISFYEASLYSETATDNTDAMIYGGRRLMPNQDVLQRAADARLPTGALFCVDYDLLSTAKQSPVGIDNFGVGNRYNLVYFPERDLT